MRIEVITKCFLWALVADDKKIIDVKFSIVGSGLLNFIYPIVIALVGYLVQLITIKPHEKFIMRSFCSPLKSLMSRLKQPLLSLLFIASPVLAQSWELVWSDEFSSGIGADWVFEEGTGSSGWGNNELQYYRQNNASVVNGELVITARRESFNGSDYTSARLKTQNRKSFQYGKIEARIAVPSASGLWPAFWMLGNSFASEGWPQCGEIDIMEHVNDEQNIHGTIHWQDHNDEYANYGGSQNLDPTQFHVYSIEWDASLIKWFVDGNQYHEASIANGVNGTDEFQGEFFLLLNMAVGGEWPGFDINEGALPAQMRVDYVRVYQQGNSDASSRSSSSTSSSSASSNSSATVFERVLEAENYSDMSGVQIETTSDTGGGTNVGWIDDGDWLSYANINIPANGRYEITYRVASPNGGQLSLDQNAGEVVLGTHTIPATGGWQSWASVTRAVELNAGTYDFGVYAASGGWNINWWRIVSLGGSASSSSSSISSSASSSGSSSSSNNGGVCNWWGTEFPLCVTIETGWGWENSKSCISPSTCESQ